MSDWADFLHAQLDEAGTPGHSTEDSVAERIDLLADQRDRYRHALEEILSPPDDSKGKYYGCLDLREARYIATEALKDDEAPA